MQHYPMPITEEMVEAGYKLLKEAGEDWEHGTGWSPELDKFLVANIFHTMQNVYLDEMNHAT